MRELRWDGSVNIRDLGGLPTSASPTGTTLERRVARGPRRELLTLTGWRAARAWGRRTIVDLRTAEEVGPPRGDPTAAGSDGITVVHTPTEDHTNPAFREACFPILDSPEYWEHNWEILPDLVRAALEAVADARPGVLVHCRAGRDRTGMMAALLLANAGVPPEIVAEDYAASVRAMAGVTHHGPTHDRQSAWDAQQVAAWLDHTVPLVVDAAANVDRALDVVGLSEPYRDRLRSLLTRPG
ncbi:tyrosine-protein phosphatase [Georgenia alba]|uniref:Tyrosine-protein phosphatase n=1 Tax=Georgenia alba TaxID=2233858 RepID=A0ABW2QDX8_9MICO